MQERYRGFNISGGAEPVLQELLGHITQWSPTGSIDYVRPRGGGRAYAVSSGRYDGQRRPSLFGLA
jgi:hypothetical protein